MNATPLFNRIALIGFGLIGGSIARAAHAQGLAGEIITTARGSRPDGSAGAPHAGDLFAVDVGVSAPPATLWRPVGGEAR